MIRFTSLRGFCGLFLLCVSWISFDLVGRAQLSYEPQERVLSSKDSLDFMTQMWHALPEAEVGGIALAGGASDASEIPSGQFEMLFTIMMESADSNNNAHRKI